MKIKIRVPKRSAETAGRKSGVRLSLVFPNALLKSRLVFKIVKRNINRKQNEKSEKLPVISAYNLDYSVIKKTYSALKTVLKDNGHFSLVDVQSADGVRVEIKV